MPITYTSPRRKRMQRYNTRTPLDVMVHLSMKTKIRESKTIWMLFQESQLIWCAFSSQYLVS